MSSRRISRVRLPVFELTFATISQIILILRTNIQIADGRVREEAVHAGAEGVLEAEEQ